MSDSDTERSRALVFLAVMSALLCVAAIVSLTTESSWSTPGVIATAFVLLAGAGSGLVASVVALVRRRGVVADAQGAVESGCTAK
ncbi:MULTISPECIES: hypothetical protein [unclassified Leifsonia]|uniref:hypothetical protein n=1 Tax=unclassified Leifsonia TaxID=2663824 RepID=UPI0008A7C604|nr:MULTISPECIES: hypothetical protein [unclassified Leifsonia]SEH55695.1 hypothetical protein SAMN04515694_10166 [Leifsonia sp. CL154]SFL23365.1 hypothetical protein SAMN04515692_101413 [Leifsonia sp. CL147]